MNVHPAGAQIGRQQEHTGSSLLSTLYIEMDIKVLTQPVFQMANECVNLSQRGVGGRRVPPHFSAASLLSHVAAQVAHVLA